MSHIRKSMPLISFRKGASGVGDVVLAVKLNLKGGGSPFLHFALR